MYGCKKIALSVHREGNTYDGDAALILDWVFYHDVLYKFSIQHWDRKAAQQTSLAGDKKIVSKAVFSPLRLHINRSLGCSLEMLDLLCRSSTLRWNRMMLDACRRSTSAR